MVVARCINGEAALRDMGIQFGLMLTFLRDLVFWVSIKKSWLFKRCRRGDSFQWSTEWSKKVGNGPKEAGSEVIICHCFFTKFFWSLYNCWIWNSKAAPFFELYAHLLLIQKGNALIGFLSVWNERTNFWDGFKNDEPFDSKRFSFNAKRQRQFYNDQSFEIKKRMKLIFLIDLLATTKNRIGGTYFCPLPAALDLPQLSDLNDVCT